MTRLDIRRTLFGVFFILAGVLHFVVPSYYRAIVPPSLPNSALLVAASGVAEIVGGAGFLMARLRSVAGIWLILLLIAVFPANVEMLQQARAHGVSPLAEAALWARLPFQGVLIWWAWRLSRTRPRPLAAEHA